MEIELPITIRSLSEAMGRPAKSIMQLLWARGDKPTINTELTEDEAIELAMESVGTYNRQCTYISRQNGQKERVKASMKMATPPTKWLNAMNFSAAKFRSAYWLLKNIPTMAAIGNAVYNAAGVRIQQLPLTAETILQEIHKQGNTVVVITHDEHIASQAGRKIRLLDGRVAEEEASL